MIVRDFILGRKFFYNIFDKCILLYLFDRMILVEENLLFLFGIMNFLIVV